MPLVARFPHVFSVLHITAPVVRLPSVWTRNSYMRLHALFLRPDGGRLRLQKIVKRAATSRDHSCRHQVEISTYEVSLASRALRVFAVCGNEISALPFSDT